MFLEGGVVRRLAALQLKTSDGRNKTTVNVYAAKVC